MTRLYKVIVTDRPGENDPGWVPDGWAEYLDREWQPSADPYEEPPSFRWPNEGKVYRSRSSATDALKRFEHWGATAYLAEAEPTWVAVSEANARRAQARKQIRINKLRAEIARLEA